MKDFDYISSGGFLIECSGGNILGVAKEQAEIVRRESYFFNNCFRHGTVEQQNGMIHKPDWPVAIARHIIEVLSKGKTTLPTLNVLQDLLHAADQACLDLRLCSMVNYIDPVLSQNSNNTFLDLVQDENYCFTWKGNIKSKEWLELLEEANILLYRKETNFVVQHYKEEEDQQQLDGDNTGNNTRATTFTNNSNSNNNNNNNNNNNARRKLDNKVSEYLVHSHRPLEAVMKIQQVIGRVMLRNCGSSYPQQDNSALQETFSIYFETTKCISDSHHELIDRLAGGEAYIRTCPDASESENTEGYTVNGSFDLLIRALRPLLEEEKGGEGGGAHSKCSLRIDHPTPDTLGRFINSCQLATDYPSTVGLDASINRYFCRKTVRDINRMLQYLSDFSTQSQIKGDFTIFAMPGSKKTF